MPIRKIPQSYYDQYFGILLNMNTYYFLTLAERLVSLYNNKMITSSHDCLTEDFIKLIREMEDALSNIE